jgi:hypothetical protein
LLLACTNLVLLPSSAIHDSHGFSINAEHCVASYALGWYAAGYICFIVVLGGFIMPTVLVGVISVAFNEGSARITAEMQSHRRVMQVVRVAQTWKTPNGSPVASNRQMHRDLRHVFDEINFSDSEDALEASLDADEMIPFLKFICKKYLTPVSEAELTRMFDVVDTSGDGNVSWAEFLWFVVFLKKEYSRAEDTEETKELEGGMEAAHDSVELEKEESLWGMEFQEHEHFCGELAKLGIAGGALLAQFEHASGERRAEYLASLQHLAKFASSPEMAASNRPRIVRRNSAMITSRLPDLDYESTDYGGTDCGSDVGLSDVSTEVDNKKPSTPSSFMRAWARRSASPPPPPPPPPRRSSDENRSTKSQPEARIDLYLCSMDA